MASRPTGLVVVSARAYSGPFPTPDPAFLDGAIGWRHLSEVDPEDSGRWRPRGFMIVYADHVLETDMAGYGMRDTVLHAP